MARYYIETEPETPIENAVEEPQLCVYCWDKKKQVNREIFFLDHTNNLRVCTFCPNCGRAL